MSQGFPSDVRIKGLNCPRFHDSIPKTQLHAKSVQTYANAKMPSPDTHERYPWQSREPRDEGDYHYTIYYPYMISQASTSSTRR